MTSKKPADRRAIYDSRRWREKIRPLKLRRDPLCQRCKYLDIVMAAEHVDHATPLALNGDPWADDNLVSLCASCHSKKTACEQSGEPFPPVVPSKPARYVIA